MHHTTVPRTSFAEDVRRSEGSGAGAIRGESLVGGPVCAGRVFAGRHRQHVRRFRHGEGAGRGGGWGDARGVCGRGLFSEARGRAVHAHGGEEWAGGGEDGGRGD